MGAIVFVLIVAVARTAGDELSARMFQKPSAHDVAITLSDIDNEKLRSYLSDVADSDSDGLISDEEAGRVTSLGEVDDSGSVTDGGVSGMGLDDVGFISSFKNLETLVCEDNGLDQIDLSRNPAIKVLCCRGNNLTSLSVPKWTDPARSPAVRCRNPPDRAGAGRTAAAAGTAGPSEGRTAAWETAARR